MRHLTGGHEPEAHRCRQHPSKRSLDRWQVPNLNEPGRDQRGQECARQQQPGKADRGSTKAGRLSPDENGERDEIDARRHLAERPVAIELLIRDPTVNVDGVAPDQGHGGRASAERLDADPQPHSKQEKQTQPVTFTPSHFLSPAGDARPLG